MRKIDKNIINRCKKIEKKKISILSKIIMVNKKKMIYAGTKLQVSDNSGVKLVKCLKVLGRRPRSYGKIGDIIVVNIQRIKIFSKIKRKDIYKAVIIRLKKKKKRIDGSSINFGKNSVVLLNNKGFPMATRIFGPVSKELRVKKFLKLASLCPKML